MANLARSAASKRARNSALHWSGGLGERDHGRGFG